MVEQFGRGSAAEAQLEYVIFFLQFVSKFAGELRITWQGKQSQTARLVEAKGKPAGFHFSSTELGGDP
jgi:hypothetical protein